MKSNLAAILMVVLAGPYTPVVTAQTDSFWANASGGNWANSANWSTADYPNNNGDDYNAFIDLMPGNSYTVNLQSPIEIENFTLDSSEATLLHTSNLLRVNQNLTINNGVYDLDGGVLANPNLQINGGTFQVGETWSGIQGGVVDGDIDLTRNRSKLYFTNASDINGTLTLGLLSELQFYGSGVELTYTFGPGSGINMLDRGSIDTRSVIKMVFENGSIVQGSGTFHAINGTATIVNNGLFDANQTLNSLSVPSSINRFENNGTYTTNNGRIYVAATTSENNGLISATDNVWSDHKDFGTHITLDSDWTNQNGQISIHNSNLYLDGDFATADIGTIVRTGGNRISVEGMWDNSGDLIDASTAGIVELAEGTITGGTIDNSTQFLRFAFFGNTFTTSNFDSVDITGGLDLTLSTSSQVRMWNNSVVLGDVTVGGKELAIGQHSVAQSEFFDNFGTVFLTVGGEFGANGPTELTVGPHTTIQGTGSLKTDMYAADDGQFISQATIIAGTPRMLLETDYFENQGAIIVPSGSELRVRRQDHFSSDLSFVQTTGTTRIENGRINATITNGNEITSILDFQGGRLEGTGIIDGDVRIGGEFDIGLSTGTIDANDGFFELQPTATTFIEIGGTNQGAQNNGYDFLDVEGPVTLDGQLSVQTVNGFQPQVGQQFEIIKVLGPLFGQFAGLAEGAVAGTFGDVDLIISYIGGTGNDVVLTAVQSTVETTNADSVNVVLGDHVDGQLSDVDNSDDTYLKYSRGNAFSPTSPSIWLEFEGVLSTDTPSSLDVVLESRVTSNGITQKIEMYNFDTGQYELVDTQGATFGTDSVANVSLTGDLTRFVEMGTNTIRTKVTYTSDGSEIVLAWQSWIDQFVWKSQQ